MSAPSKRKTEIIAISSGKGGTGKTLISACLGYALTRSNHKVLMIDGDAGTDGLSLFLLGPEGMDALQDFVPRNTFLGVLKGHHDNKKSDNENIDFEPHPVNRKHDHGIIYTALISGKGIYGKLDGNQPDTVVPRLDQPTYQETVGALFNELRSRGEFDYVLVDTRGGFAFESTSICALADSFIVVTEADYTSFYQDRNLIKWIDRAAGILKSDPLLRAMIVNKATDGEETSFRLELVKEFPIEYSATYSVPLDLDAIKAYRGQLIPYVTAPASEFSSATLRAFAHIMRLVTSGWEEERIDKWNDLVAEISTSHKEKYSFRTLKRQWLRANRYPIGVLAMLALIWTATFNYINYQNRVNELDLKALYSTNTSSSSRINQLVSLYDAGMRSFNGVDLSRLDLSELILRSIELRRANLTKAVLSSTDLTGAILRGSNMRGANLENAVLMSADLGATDLRSANLRGANLQAAELSGAILDRANLRGANLRRANLQDVDLTDSILDGADLRSANLGSAKLTPRQIETAVKDESTILPGGIRPLWVGDASKGRAIYDTYCVACHGSQGRGDGPAAATLPMKLGDHTDNKYMSLFKDRELFEIIREGGSFVGKSDFMPAWGATLSGGQIRDVVAYIRSLANQPKKF